MDKTVKIGLTTKEALKRLHKDISSILLEHEESQRKRRKSVFQDGSWINESLDPNSQYTTLCWTSAVILLINGLVFILAYFLCDSPRYSFLPLQGLTIIILLAINFFLVAWDNKLRHIEIPQRIRYILSQLEVASEKVQWSSNNYPHLCSPYSPCITLQWTYRDGHLVNLPWALLVAGDVVLMRPGQQAPGTCVSLEDKEGTVLQAGEVYSPPLHEQVREVFSVPKARTPLPNACHALQETPYLNNLRTALNGALSRPASCQNRGLHLLMVTCIEQAAVPTILVSVIFICILRHLYLSQWVGAGHWTEMFLLLPASVSLPLLPIVFPTFWLFFNSLGMARIQALFQSTNQSRPVPLDPFDETDLSEPTHPAIEISWREVNNCLLDVISGKGKVLCRTANLLHVLGSVTALCCVDKKGILSWPNPTAEKVFFLRSSKPTSRSSSVISMNACYNAPPTAGGDVGQHYKGAGEEADVDMTDGPKPTFRSHDSGASQTVAEVLDLTHDHGSPFRLQFDDQTWRRHLSSLKPLGLAILLNTCNMDTQEHYARFCSHVTCEAMYNEDLVPVTNRRMLDLWGEMAMFPGANKCLCELAKQIGFSDQAQDIFILEEQLSTFRHVQPEMVRRDIKFARSLSITKLKFPFPHMVGTVVRELSSGALQLMSQGTADIILDSCLEFWDGQDLCPLSPADRKKVQDFYQRTSLTAYCSAFAYRPLSRSVSSHLSNVYLELPADSKHLYMPYRSPTPMHWDSHRSGHSSNGHPLHGLLAQFHSTDSLLGIDGQEEKVCDIEGCFDLQCNQIFIGMVTMQYQAQIDMVQLIEQLERACIRFVHFSKENELRSRVFSEKMGLESGWNCHISLLSERTRSESGNSSSWPRSTTPQTANVRLSRLSLPKYPTQQQLQQHPRERGGRAEDGNSMHLHGARSLGYTRAMSFSAPSAINMEFSQVKFEEDEGTFQGDDDSPLTKGLGNPRSPGMRRGGNGPPMTSQDSVLVQSVDLTSQQEAWRSLSCLTDSTEQSAPVNFDMSNRAKLPRGIEKIRPHLEQIDNVPLLVSLFTDCTPSATREMLHIMQEYGEVVCVMGSLANAHNMPIFMQADASLGVEPLYPQVCQKVPVYVPTSPDCGPSPVELSQTLSSIVCSLSFVRDAPISIFHLIMESRHYMQCVWNVVQFWMSCVVSLSLVQFLGVLLMLPPVFSTGQVLWLICVIIPILAMSLIGTPTDPKVMHRATGKGQSHVTMEVALLVLWCYGAKFLPSVFIVILLSGITLSHLCAKVASAMARVGVNTTCSMVYPLLSPSEDRGSLRPNWDEWGGWGYDHGNGICLAQLLATFFLVIYFVTISIGFVHRHYPIWKKNPLTNKLWASVSLIIICLQILFTGVSISIMETELDEENTNTANESLNLLLGDIPWHIHFIGFLAPVLIFPVTELIKWIENKANVRYQKKARLEFGTKLGMNSPF
ncbi:transmembrane protein 94 isoform X2 [Ischnura elegans]|nr:transmembrane protein 94 isoform X2 [Ischnura elegans]